MHAFTYMEKSSGFSFLFNKWPEGTPAIKISYRQTHPPAKKLKDTPQHLKTSVDKYF